MEKLMTETFLTDVSPEEYEDCYCYEDYLVDYEVNKKKLYRIYNECLMSKKTKKKNSIENLVVGNGFLSDVSFDVRKLRKNIDGIIGVIDFFYIDEEPFGNISFSDCGTVAYDDGQLRAYVDEDAEMLTQLGTAIGEISILQMPKDFETEGTLFAIRNKTSVNDDNKVYFK